MNFKKEHVAELNKESLQATNSGQNTLYIDLTPLFRLIQQTGVTQ